MIGALVFVGSKMGLPYAPPLVLAALRLDVAGLLLVPIVAFQYEYWLPQTRRDFIGVTLTGVFTLGATNTLLLAGQQYISSAVGAIAYSLMPMLMTAFAVLILPAAGLDRSDVVGIGLGFIGALIVANPTPAALLTSRVVGVGIMLASVVVFALGSVLTQRLDPSMPRITLTAWGALLAGLFNHAVTLRFGGSLADVEWTVQMVYALFVLGVIATGILYVTHFELINRIGPSRASLNFYVQPIVAAPLGWVIFGRQVTVSVFIGFLIIVLGFALIEYQLVIRIWRKFIGIGTQE
ncbi:DMT family transporter [Halococcus sediminicola]|uniref:DMT family transporter n=1 Tax=Halococcus sediminicola TaxID=1264579 RepID=UPI0006784FAF|nr:DMT family transporter [Halococcus sediminicola]